MVFCLKAGSSWKLLPSIRPSKTSFTRLSPLKMCPSHRFILSNIALKSFPFSFTWSYTYSFVMWSFQQIFSILRHVHISKASNLSISYFLNVQVSDPYNTMLIITFFFKSLLNLFENSYLLLLNALLAIASPVIWDEWSQITKLVLLFYPLSLYHYVDWINTFAFATIPLLFVVPSPSVSPFLDWPHHWNLTFFSSSFLL